MLIDAKQNIGQVIFPPYGVMTDGLQQELDGFPEIPPDFLPIAHPQESSREDAWRAWKRETIELLGRSLWPSWDITQRQWSDPNAEKMVGLTAKDLEFISEMRVKDLHELPSSPLRSTDCPVHQTFYRSEDDQDWFLQYRFYDSTLTSDFINELSQVFGCRADDKSGSVHLQIKTVFQRPRPFQTVFLLHKPTIKPLQAISAGSPSLCSGHSFQASLGIGAVMEFLLLREKKLSSNSWTALRQHAVDIGDRRVFAGVHYPSDNLASWIVAMRLANYVYRVPDVKVHLWHAISRQSAVFGAISREPVYQEAIKILREAAADAEEAASRIS